MKKIIFILILGFIARLFFSCCRCSTDTISIEYNQITIGSNDKNTAYGDLVPLVSDTMLSTSVAFNIALSDSTIDTHLVYFGQNRQISGFSTASATTCDCPQLFKTTQRIVDIKIFTLEDMSDQIKANSEVTRYFVAYPSTSKLYTEIDKLYPLINTEIVSSSPMNNFQVFCKENIQNNKAQFIVNIELSDGVVLTAFTNLIHILPNS